MIRVIVIEDELIVGHGLKSSFRSSRDDIQITEIYRDVEDAIRKKKPSLIDLIILDLWIGKRDPVENVKKLKEYFPGKPILIFTGEDSLEWRNRMIRCGVEGYIQKDSMTHEIKVAIQQVYLNKYYFPYTYCQSEINQGTFHSQDYLLVFLLSEGYSLGEIAEKQNSCYSKIEKRLGILRREFKVSNNTELVKVFLESNFLQSRV